MDENTERQQITNLDKIIDATEALRQTVWYLELQLCNRQPPHYTPPIQTDARSLTQHKRHIVRNAERLRIALDEAINTLQTTRN